MGTTAVPTHFTVRRSTLIYPPTPRSKLPSRGIFWPYLGRPSISDGWPCFHIRGHTWKQRGCSSQPPMA